MKKLVFICGPNGIGKTTISKEIVKLVPNTAYVDTDPLRYMNPFVLNDETIPTIAKNISDLIGNYLNCSVVDNVVFSYGFHGRRQEVFDEVLKNINNLEYHFIPFLLWCSEEENINRMQTDKRNHSRIQRAVNISRKAYSDVSYPKIGITHLSAVESAYRIIDASELGISTGR